MKKILAFLFLLLAFIAKPLAQSESLVLVVDLAAGAGSTITAPIKTGDYVIVVKNKLPGKQYEIKIELEDRLLQEFTLPGDIKTSSLQGCACEEFSALLNEIKGLEDETIFPEKRTALEQALTFCSACDAYVEAKKMFSETEYRYEVTSISKDQILRVTIKRINKEGKEMKWVRTFESPSRGRWLTNYSFNFIASQMGSKEQLFFAKAKSADEFVITQEENRQWVKFVPGVTFTWMPAKGLKKPLILGGSGGIGFDLENPVVYLGASFIYQQNLSLTFGYAAHRVKQLNGKYQEGDIIRENLTPDQLMIEPYRFNPFISLSLRFDKNPFKLGKPKEESE